MSDSFAGLTRRINEFVHDRETSEELSHLVEETREPHGDECDALIELALGDESLLPEVFAEGALDPELEALVEEDELIDDEGAEIEDPAAAEAEADADMAALVDDLEGDDDLDGDGIDDDEQLGESAALQLGEVLII